MKTITLLSCFLAAITMSFSLHSAESKKIPILWKTKAAEPAKFQIVAFGFLDDKEKMIFAYQIKDVAELMQQKTYFCQYYNADNDVKTGRFPKSLGIDLQINGRLKEGADFQPMTWNSENKATDLKIRRGDKVLMRNGDVVFYIFPKKALGDLKFNSKFRIDTSFSVEGRKEGPRPIRISGNPVVDTTKPLGEFEMPESK